MTSKTDHISVCICTYKRPALLRRLLLKLQEIETEGLFQYSLAIVDNDVCESARHVVESAARESSVSVLYYVEPEQNIALARNRVVEQAVGDLLAFIDDDEYPNPDWLVVLYKAMLRYKADGILGPVLPHFEEKPPAWVLKGCFFDRPTHPNGHVLAWKNTRTGNVLLRRELFQKGHEWFDPAMGSGGEDRDFFKRKIEDGYVFRWCNDAPVFETIPPARWKRSVLLKRALVRGKMALNNTQSQPISVFKSIIAVVVYTTCLPLFFLMGQHIFMRFLIKNCDHLGKVLAFWGVDWVKQKYVAG